MTDFVSLRNPGAACCRGQKENHASTVFILNIGKKPAKYSITGRLPLLDTTKPGDHALIFGNKGVVTGFDKPRRLPDMPSLVL